MGRAPTFVQAFDMILQGFVSKSSKTHIETIEHESNEIQVLTETNEKNTSNNVLPTIPFWEPPIKPLVDLPVEPLDFVG